MRVIRLGWIFLSWFLLLAPLAAQQPQHARDYIYGPSGKLALTIEPDNYPPSAPTDLWGEFDILSCTIPLSWSASSDIGSGVSGYKVYKGTVFQGSTSTTSFTANAPYWGGTSIFTVKAYDAPGHLSAASSQFKIITESCQGAWNVLPRDPFKALEESRFFAFLNWAEPFSSHPKSPSRLRWLEHFGLLKQYKPSTVEAGGGL